MNQVKCAAVIPCFNEAPTIASVVAGALRHVERVYVVDDGSSDNTAAVAEKAGAQALRLWKNSGKGAALRVGFARAADDRFDCALMLDGDGQHDPAEIPKFFTEDADLVVGNRMHSPGEMPWARRCVNRWMSARLSRGLGKTFPDSQCGFRLVRLGAWREVDINTCRYEIESEMLAAFARASRKIAFVPVRCLPAPRPSRIRPVSDTLRWFAWWIAFNAQYGIGHHP